MATSAIDDALPDCFSDHKDLRAPSIPRKREAVERQKYFGFRGINRGAVGQSYIALEFGTDSCMKCGNDPLLSEPTAKKSIKTWSRMDMFAERQWNIWPLRYPHHVCGYFCFFSHSLLTT